MHNSALILPCTAWKQGGRGDEEGHSRLGLHKPRSSEPFIRTMSLPMDLSLDTKEIEKMQTKQNLWRRLCRFVLLNIQKVQIACKKSIHFRSVHKEAVRVRAAWSVQVNCTSIALDKQKNGESLHGCARCKVIQALEPYPDKARDAVTRSQI